MNKENMNKSFLDLLFHEKDVDMKSLSKILEDPKNNLNVNNDDHPSFTFYAGRRLGVRIFKNDDGCLGPVFNITREEAMSRLSNLELKKFGKYLIVSSKFWTVEENGFDNICISFRNTEDTNKMFRQQDTEDYTIFDNLFEKSKISYEKIEKNLGLKFYEESFFEISSHKYCHEELFIDDAPIDNKHYISFFEITKSEAINRLESLVNKKIGNYIITRWEFNSDEHHATITVYIKDTSGRKGPKKWKAYD